MERAMRFLLFVVLSSVVVEAHAAKPDAFDREIKWTLSLDADGKIASLEPIDRDYLPEVRHQIEPIVRNWHFTNRRTPPTIRQGSRRPARGRDISTSSCRTIRKRRSTRTTRAR
jgi:hypothetical protein